MVLPTAGHRTLANYAVYRGKKGGGCIVLAMGLDVGLTSQGKNIRKILNALGSDVIKIKRKKYYKFKCTTAVALHRAFRAS